jgi:alanyl-tRNA synthetase
MTSTEIRQKFLNFFEKKGHKIVSSSSLLPTDPSVLFTTAGMQQFKPYYLGEKSPFGQNVTTSQKCFRTSDIDEVGDESHLTFLEMLGNFSFGGYFKQEAIKLAYEFLFTELKLSPDQAVFTVFEGDKDVPEDKESAEIWKKLGVPDGRIKKCGRADNFWGPTGEEGPCGPTSEIHVNGTEIWNLVFNEYFMDRNKKLTPLEQKGVDTGMGLERLAMIVQEKPSVFGTDLFSPIIEEIPGSNQKAKRIISDHIKGSVFLISEGILPSNVERGYVLRRILRRAIRYGKLLNLPKNFLIPLAQKVIDIYQNVYPELKSNEADILTVIQNEEEKFEKTLEQGLKEFNNFVLRREPKKGKAGVARDQAVLYGKDAFYLYQTFGFPKELMQEICKEKNINFDEEEFEKELNKHREISRAGMEKKFKSGLADTSEQTVKYHTATHLLLAALREVLGPEIYQKGSNVTPERLRFDFNYPEKLSEKQIKKIEDLVNRKIKEDIAVEMTELPKEEALKMARISFDPSKYGKVVRVYKINDFSVELCAGPHVKRTSELGEFKITKEESSGAGIRRIRAVLK